MLFNKEKRIKYLGFNDLWLSVIGILALSFITDYLFSRSFVRYELKYALINWSVSLFFSITYWLTLRAVLIALRKRYPDISQVGKRIWRLVIIIIFGVVVIDVLGNLLLGFIYEGSFNPLNRFNVLIPVVMICTMTMAIYEAIYLFIMLKISIREEEQAKQAIVQAQLDALRNQAQPHFFFNSLNTLRDIIDQNPREDAKEFVDRLAEVYRFILESGNMNLITLKDEIHFAKAYIHIQNERFGDNLKVNWNIPENTIHAMVIPMSLQLLLENAIKHNVVSKSKPLLIEVKADNKTLMVENKLQPKSTKLPSTKMGLKNIDDRYKLISDRPMVIDKDQSSFSVSIPLLESSKPAASYANIDH